MILPAGLWGIADGLRDVRDAEAWEQTAAACALWTLRRPTGGDRAAVGIVRRWVAAARTVAVHGRGDLARAGGAAAVIAGWRGLRYSELRRLHPTLQVGAAAHALDEAQYLRDAGADFLIHGPIWDTPSKRDFITARGLDELAAVVALGVPVVAIGGIQSPEQVAACAQHGAHGVAVLRAASDAALCAELAAAYASSVNGPCTGLE